MTVRIGLGVFTGQVPSGGQRTISQEYADVLHLARLAERLGFDSFWVSEHHGGEDSNLPSPIVMLAAIAAVTERIKLGTAVAIAPFQHPLRFAEDCAVLDQLSRGRLVVGMSIGWRKKEFEAFGVPLNERVGRTVELVRVCRAAWDHERFTFEGVHFQFRDVLVTPKPYGQLPILLGGTVPEAAARAGTVADGYFGNPRKDIGAFRRLVASFDDAARVRGRDPREMMIGFHVDTWVSADGRLPDHVHRAMMYALNKHALWREQDAGSTSAPPPVEEAQLRARSLLGTPAEVIAEARPWIEEFKGRNLHVSVRMHYPGMTAAEAAPAVELFANDVLPELRRIGSSS